MMNRFQCGRYSFSLPAERPLVMGILNVTPDSFSDGGQYLSLPAALDRAEKMIADGVDIIDIGAESSRPGATPLPLQQELDRVMPVIYALRDCGRPLSIDTYKPEVMSEALIAGADMINDINGFESEQAQAVVRNATCGLCVMHKQGDPETMQHQPVYADILEEVTDFLKERVAALRASGVVAERICIDPGFGFGKTLAHNLVLLKKLKVFQQTLGFPVLAGLSRKSMIGALTDRGVEQRLAGSLAAALAAAHRDAFIVRVHDVAETVDALTVWQAIEQA